MREQEHGSATGRGLQFVSILLLILAGVLVWTLKRKQAPAPSPIAVATPKPISAQGNLAANERSTIALFNQTSPSVVNVTSLKLKQNRLTLNVLEIPQGSGTGFVWDKKGHIVTNYHVIQGANGALVTTENNTTLRAKIIGTAKDKDIAVLKIETEDIAWSPILVGSSANLQVGQSVFAIGNPFGLDQTLTMGIISGLNREIESMTRRPIFGVIQTDAAINKGNSGGPLLDSSGQLIGINTQIYSPTGGNIGIGFAVPVDTVNRIVPQLIENGQVKRPGLGIDIGSDEWGKRLGIVGVFILKVSADSAAKRAGLVGIQKDAKGQWVPGDIIVGIDGQAVSNSDDLFRILDSKSVGDQIVIDVERNGTGRNTKLTLQDLP